MSKSDKKDKNKKKDRKEKKRKRDLESSDDDRGSKRLQKEVCASLRGEHIRDIGARILKTLFLFISVKA